MECRSMSPLRSLLRHSTRTLLCLWSWFRALFGAVVRPWMPRPSACPDPTEDKGVTPEHRKVRGYNIARLYYNVGEYASAARYLAEFLTVRPRAMDAHRLLGQVHEGLGNKEKAVQAYKTAYELGEGQKDLVLKICDLYTEVEADSSVRLYWAEEGQRLYPHRESVVKLRETLLSRDGTKSREELEKLYLEEINASPTEVRLQTNLLRLYRDWGAEDSAKLAEAYSYACQVEARKPFSDSLQWYQTLLDVMQAYRSTRDVSADETFHTQYLSALERLVYLTLASCSASALLSQYTLQDAASLLHKFDQSLKSHLHVVGAKSMFGQLMVGQLYLHMGIFLIHNAKKEGLTQANITSGALLFHACRFRPPEKTKAWRAKEYFWHKLACHRLSQAAHVLRHMAGADADRTRFLDRVKQQCSNKEAQLGIHQALFGASANTKKDVAGSFFLCDEEFVTAPLQYPEAEQLKEWDQVVGSMFCSSLGDLVWLCLQQAPEDLHEPQPYYSFTLFDGLQFSSTSLSTWSPETLCHLDLLAFLAATVYCQRVAGKETHGPPPASLPTVLSAPLCTQEQGECWGAAHTLFNNRAHHRLSKLRMTLQRGLEVIRAHGNHGIDLPLMAHLAQCFTKWASVAEADGSAANEVEALRERAEQYWQRVQSLCVRAARNTVSVAPRNPLFVAPGMSLSDEERSKVEEEGKFFLALRLVQAGRQQDAIQALGELKSPEAAFQRAMLYNEQAQAIVGEGGLEAATPEARAQQASLLTQARDTLYLTLDRLRMPGVDRFHPLNTKLSQQLEDVERRLSLLTPAGQSTHHHHHLHHHTEEDAESFSDASHSAHDLTNGHDPSSSPHHPLHPQLLPSTPLARSFLASSAANSPQKALSSRVIRQEARPSPERLHAQVQALSEVQENTLRSMEEQNAALKAQNQALRDLCTSMADGFRENSNLYHSMLEQNRALSQDAYTSVLGEVRQVHSALKDTQTQLRAMATDLADLRSMRATAVVTPSKLQEVAEVKASEEVPVDIPAAVVPPGLYGSYVGYYSQPSPLMPTPGLFGNPPFFPPSTVPEQTYSIASSVNQSGGMSSMAQTTATPCSPASITVPSPATTSLPYSQATTGSWSVASSLGNNNTGKGQSGDSPAPAHAFQIAMPPSSSSTLTPPPRTSMPGELLSHSLPCSTTAGLLANVPPPLYSAVTPDSSPVRGQSHVRALSSELSTEGMSPAPNNMVAPSTTTTAPGSSQDTSPLTFPGGFRSPTVAPTKDIKVSPVKGNQAEDDNECYVEDDHDPCPDYKPLVPLPEKVEVRTGEEDEQVLFEERAKLFRFVDKEWRERGTGVMKLLHNPGQSSARVLMRRDQTHKICANHLITSNIEVQPLVGSDRAWIWAAKDFADEELRTEKFCCRFKTVEVANSFREAFMKAKAIAKAKEDSGVGSDQGKTEGVPGVTSYGTTSIKTSTPIKQQTPSPSAAATSSTPSLAMLFKPPPGSWKCNTCLVTNKQEDGQCVACQMPNPTATTPAKSDVPASSLASSPFATFKFSPSVPTEGGAATTTTTTASSPAPTVGFKFMGFPSTTANTSTPSTISTPAQPSAAASTAATTPSTFGFKFNLSSTTTGSPSVSAAPPPTTSSTPASEGSKDPGKFSLSGFTFSSTPSISPEKKKEEPKEEKKKDLVFSGFSFGSNATSSAPSASFTFAAPSESSGNAGGGSLFGGKSAASTVMSFGSPATTATSAPSIFTTKAFEPQTPAGVTKSPQKDDSDDRVEEYEPQVDFQPVVPMPDLVEVKTGEEGEEVLFCERSKLFRYDKDTKEWKERGVGELKILRNSASGKVRVLMRRDQVLKVCANHFITPGIKVTPMVSSDKTWIWAAQDFADEEVRQQQFAARFKTQELALSFKEAFEKAQVTLEASTAEQDTAKPAEPSTGAAAPSSGAPSLASLFPKAADSWECQACLVRNKGENAECVSCTTPREAKEKGPTPKDKPKAVTTAPATSSFAGMFQPPKGSWECDTCLVRNNADTQTCVACGSLAPGAADVSDQAIDLSKGQSPSSTSALGPSTFKFSAESNKQAFSFGIPQSQQEASPAPPTQSTFTFGLNTSAEATNTTKPTATFSFGITDTKTAQPAFSFGSSAPTNKPFAFTWQPPAPTGPSVSFAPTQPVAIPSSQHGEEPTTPTSGMTPTKGGFVFGSPGKYEFSFAGVKAKSPRSRDISLCESEEGLVEEDEGDHLYFEPVVPLPDKVDVVTGEEDEEMAYSHRAKLFRLVTGEWKERGIGDFKILIHKQNGKVRLLMRREQVHKLCLNHYLEKDLEVRRKDDKTFYWAALDHSEATAKTETFALRFKTPEIAAEFFVALNDAKVKLGGTATELPQAESTTPAKGNTAASSATTTPAKENVTVVAQADTTTPASEPLKTLTINATTPAASSLFAGATKSLFGDPARGDTTTSNNNNTSLFSSTPNTSTSTFAITTSASLFGGTTKTPLFGNTNTTSPAFPNASSAPPVFGGPPAFTVNVSSNFSLRSSLPLSMSTGSTTSKLSIFGGATTTSSIPRSSFSFGDKFSSEPDSSDEVQVVYEKTATAEQVERARKLHLPDNFYLYEDAPPCPGCPGCEDEESDKDEVVKITASTPMFGGPSIKPVQFGATSAPSTTPATFGKLTTDSPSIFGGAKTPTTAASSTPSLFGASKPAIFSGPGIFGGTPSTSGSIFGGTASSSGSIFGATPASSASIFGGTPTTSSSAMGGTPTTSIVFGAHTTTATMTGIFSNFSASASTPSSGLTGGTAPSNKLFSTPTTTTSPTTPGFFTASLASATAAASAATTTPSLFGTPPAGLLLPSGPFGGKGGAGGLLQTSQPSQSPAAVTSASTPSLSEGASLFPSAKSTDSQLTFADLAQGSGGDGFRKKPLDPKVAAVWATQGQPVFGKSPKKDGDEDGEDDDSHDPHFEPVVPLPDLVEVKTGEEDLQVIFCHRAKLYRYDGATKQWKERGVGDFKILYDPSTAKYRLLQRREQVHKLCCNHHLTAQLVIRPLQSSETAWCWYATDFSEKAEGVNEQLAVKFKTIELAKEFKTKFEDCQEQLRRNPPPPSAPPADSSSTSTSATVVLPLSTTNTTEEHDEDDEEDGDEEVEEEEEEDDDDEVDTEDEDEEDEDEEEDSTVMFSERCTLSVKDMNQWKLLGAGRLTMQYDDDVFGARITIESDSGDTLAEHIVAIQTAMHKEGHCATWSVLNLKPEPQSHATFKAKFFTQQAIDMFAKAFAEAKEYAENSNLAEEPSLSFGEVLASDLYYGQGAEED
ncbi:E3 SUMO-protein ligase RanBP2-like isoform X2 [Eriocheir sinensis]|uniref:E3 SUMO-protein ligase RanBP2-like isoform X2 n=1 Tax=Eriocheir sinensis TaxID=95602 RepID=UPI0021C75C56|nr:E3 SUMO-protein ligase RanBP2-like isoform X2 [Eriocheir sinensis]